MKAKEPIQNKNIDFLKKLDSQLTDCYKKYNVSGVNQEIINKYLLTFRDVGKPRAMNTIRNQTGLMIYVARNVKTDLDKLTENDINQFKSVVAYETKKDGTPIKHSTKMSYLMGLKQFLKWYAKKYKRSDYKEIIEEIHIELIPSRKSPSDLLEEEEVDRMIEVADNPRDKAIIAVLYESGCREGELVSSKIKHLRFTNDCVFLTFPESKTARGNRIDRTIPLVQSISYLRTWIDNHPLKNTPEADLWVGLRKKEGKFQAIKEDTILHIVHELAEKIDLKKRCYPHLFRHTAATEMSKTLKEPQMRLYFGWSPTSMQPATYVHLSGHDLEEAVKAKHGLVDEKKEKPKVQRCPRCDLLVSSNKNYCDRCGAAVGQRLQQTDEIVMEAMRKIILQENPEILERVAKTMLKK